MNYKFGLTMAAMIFSLSTVYAVETSSPTSPPPAPTDSRDQRPRQQRREEFRAHMERVRNACSADITTAGCANEQGRRAIKCVQRYKKNNPSFTLSASCNTALEEARAQRKEMKMAKKARRSNRH